MLIFRESGRLGNQLFQYAALNALARPGEKIVLLGFEELKRAFSGINATLVSRSGSRAERFVYHRLNSLWSRVPCVPRLRVVDELPASGAAIEGPRRRRVVLVEEAYFQREAHFTPDSIRSLSLKECHQGHATLLLSRLDPGRVPFFVHVRRGDYLTWPSKEHPAVLPASFYRECIAQVREKEPRAFLFFVSDDPHYVKDVFGEVKDSVVSQGTALEDFALMSRCEGGILSASSFSWWAAYFSFSRNPTGRFLAPRYWAGHRTAEWYPKFIQSSFLEYVAVPDDTAWRHPRRDDLGRVED